ncbi:MAG: hypothetical protein ACLR7U_04455 [Ruthenibacterium lactatiformans]
MAEALLRLCGADGKPVPTADVVSVAEEMDLIVALDWMMLEQVCAFSVHTASWMDARSL